MAPKKHPTLDNLFQNIDPYGAGAVAPAAPAGVTYLPLDQVWPDPNQPRQILPAAIAEAFRASGQAADTLTSWAQLGQAGDDVATEAYAELESLARSIEADGLISPISVVALGGSYQIVSGERRWWAHQLLNQQGHAPKGGQPGRIAVLVRTAGEVGPTQQLVENLQRQDLCAVEVAVGLAELVAQLEGVELHTPVYNPGGAPPSGTMVPLRSEGAPRSETVPSEGNSQSGTTVPLPAGVDSQSGTMVPLLAEVRLAALRKMAHRRLKPGTWEQVILHLGKGRRHWANYLALLRLPDEALELALRHRLTERALRPAVAEADPVRQQALVRSAIARQQREQTEGAPASADAAGAAPPALSFSRKFANGLRGFSRTFETLGRGQVPAHTLVKELKQDEHFDEIVQTAKRLQPLIEAIVKAAEKK